MTRELLNTLYIQAEGAYAHLKGETVMVEKDGDTLLRVPLHHIGCIAVFGVVNLSGPLIQKCAEEGRAVVFFDLNGRFKARVTGKAHGNVLLRRDQWMAHFDEQRTLNLARSFVAGKLQNSRQVLQRGGREYDDADLRDAATAHSQWLEECAVANDIDELRGVEGIAAQAYFSVFDSMIRQNRTMFRFTYRNRRPPRDRINALISFLYSMGTSDCVAALEGVGLDPQVGYLHVLRPGRPALALDLVEEFRAILLDRLALNMVNRKEIKPDDFDVREGGAVLLNKEGRKKVLAAYQLRKKEEVPHSLLKSKVPMGLLPHLQARLLARHLRGDTEFYTPWIAR